jgi:hypothetical protein
MSTQDRERRAWQAVAICSDGNPSSYLWMAAVLLRVNKTLAGTKGDAGATYGLSTLQACN